MKKLIFHSSKTHVTPQVNRSVSITQEIYFDILINLLSERYIFLFQQKNLLTSKTGMIKILHKNRVKMNEYW